MLAVVLLIHSATVLELLPLHDDAVSSPGWREVGEGGEEREEEEEVEEEDRMEKEEEGMVDANGREMEEEEIEEGVEDDGGIEEEVDLMMDRREAAEEGGAIAA